MSPGASHYCAAAAASAAPQVPRQHRRLLLRLLPSQQLLLLALLVVVLAAAATITPAAAAAAATTCPGGVRPAAFIQSQVKGLGITACGTDPVTSLPSAYASSGSCADTFQRLIDAADSSTVWPPPRYPPGELLPAYTLCDSIPMQDMYRTQQYNQNASRTLLWDTPYIERLMGRARRKLGFNYGKMQKAFYAAFDAHSPQGLAGIVFGSEIPWAEALSLSYGATHMTTSEYSQIETKDARLSAYHPIDLAHRFLKGTAPSFDFGISFSSFEHSGLGRYGDPLDPWGDVKSMQSASCLIKPGGLLYLGVPSGVDTLFWNAHRMYGAVRFPLLTSGWQVLGWFTANGTMTEAEAREMHLTNRDFRNQPLVVLKNMKGKACSRLLTRRRN